MTYQAWLELVAQALGDGDPPDFREWWFQDAYQDGVEPAAAALELMDLRRTDNAIQSLPGRSPENTSPSGGASHQG